MPQIPIAIIGLGKIAREQHIPAIAANPDFRLVATVSPRGGPQAGAPNFASTAEMLAALPDLKAVAISTPPSARYAIARECILAGLDVLLEKPPTATLGEIDELAELARTRAATLFTTWHAQFNPAVQAAAAALAGERIAAMEINWREDVRKWHPGQAWIWKPGGFGVFDAGINALSIATHIMPASLLMTEATLYFPENREAPIAATLSLASPSAEGSLTAVLDWRHSGAEAWTIDIKTVGGAMLRLSDGGTRLAIDGEQWRGSGPGEYPAIYERFAALIRSRASHIDVQPLRLVADAFLVGRRETFETFVE